MGEETDEIVNAWQQQESKLDVAILLIYAAVAAMRERRKTERIVGYPEEYGHDKFVLEKMEEFLNHPQMKARVLELIK